MGVLGRSRRHWLIKRQYSSALVNQLLPTTQTLGTLLCTTTVLAFPYYIEPTHGRVETLGIKRTRLRISSRTVFLVRAHDIANDRLLLQICQEVHRCMKQWCMQSITADVAARSLRKHIQYIRIPQQRTTA